MWTGDLNGAGTDANVFLQMYGEHGHKTEELQLRNRTDNFEKGECDKFKVGVGQLVHEHVSSNTACIRIF